MNDNEKYIEEFVNDIPFDTPDNEHRDKLKKQLLNAFPKHRLQPTVNTVQVWRKIMKSSTTRIAAAAVIIIAVLAGLPFLGDYGTGVALADVLEKVQQARAFIYRMKTTMTGNMILGMPAQQEITTVTISNEYGTKWDVDKSYPGSGEKKTQQVYVIPGQKTVVSLMPEMKQYMRMELNDDWLARMKKQNNDPREMIKQIMNCEYTELGKSVIDGVEVEGFQTTDPAYFAGAAEEGTSTLWVDAETWLPVRSEVDFKMGEQTSVHSVTYDYQWDIPVNASEFQPVIPEDFTAFATDGMKMPGMSEQDAIEGLKLFAEMSGRYPEKITLVELGQEILALSQDVENMKDLTDRLKKLTEELSQTQMTKEEIRNAVMKKSMEIMQPMQSPGWFYMMLVTDKKEPVYNGESVGPDDAEAVLMRWKVSENRYRVIFGDLSTLDVSYDELAQLEQK
ncbi:MAG: hypothetical protein GY774_14115 [Planctomycetes bacterium]|nr:hypothetical protein [Planctomycetota bacterium]